MESELSIWTQIPPGLFLIAASILLPLSPRKLQPVVLLTLPLLAIWVIWQIPAPDAWQEPVFNIAGFDLRMLHAHPYTPIFATVFALTAFAGGLYAFWQARTLELSAAMLYSGSALGAVFSGDWLSFFIFWEIMAIGSTIVVLCGGMKNSVQAATRYAIMHFLGGVILMIGIAAQIIVQDGDTSIIAMKATMANWESLLAFDLQGVAVWFILLGILINAGAPPFSAWLPDAYPEASPSGTVFLSAYTTKTAVFALLTMFAGSEVLIYVGLFMIFYGIIFAILENDMRRILAYSIVNQVGFMVTGAGIGTQMALNGAAAHAFCHIIYKALLMMSAGSVLYLTNKRKCTDLGGLFRTLPITMVCGIVGALSISAFPWTSGFVSKSMISSAAVTQEMLYVWLLLAAASAGVFLHAGIKFPWFVFFHRDSGMRPSEAPKNMLIAMILLSALCILPGFFPEYLYQMLPNEVNYDAYAHGHTVSQLQLLLFSGLAFFMMLPLLRRTETISLDFDWIYRVLMYRIMRVADLVLFAFRDMVVHKGNKTVKSTMRHLRAWYAPGGILTDYWPIGITVLWTSALLAALLVIYYSY